MVRKPRIHIPNGYYHVIQRGVERRDIFLDHKDRERFLDLLGEMVGAHDCRVHAWCLMSNHVHLVIQVGVESLSKPMQQLFFRYAGWFNRRHGRSGHLFQGRYKAVLVDSEPYIKELVRYVHLNPVRAKLHRKPERYRYSSHQYYISGAGPEWLTTTQVLGMFSVRPTTARQRFQQFVREGIGKAVQFDFSAGNHKDHEMLVPDGFAADVLRRGNQALAKQVDLEHVISAVESVYGMTLKELAAKGKHLNRAEARGMLVAVARQRTEATLSQLARKLNRDTGTLSRSADNAERLRKTNSEAKARYDAILSKL